MIFHVFRNWSKKIQYRTKPQLPSYPGNFLHRKVGFGKENRQKGNSKKQFQSFEKAFKLSRNSSNNKLLKKENRILRNMGRLFATFANILLNLQNSYEDYEDERISMNKKRILSPQVTIQDFQISAKEFSHFPNILK